MKLPRSRMSAGESGQALVLLVVGALVVLLAVAAVGQVGAAFVARGRLQRAADLAAVAAARSMSTDYPGLFAVKRPPAGRHLSRDQYVKRAREVARRSLAANGAARLNRSIRFEPGYAPTWVKVAVSGSHAVTAPGAPRGHAVAVRTSATARLDFSAIAPRDPLPVVAAGGGYSGPLLYRQGKPMRPDVAAAFDRLALAASGAGHALIVSSAFRSDAEQARLFARRPDPKWVAPPGTSLHRYATELDLGPPSAYAWLARNARREGFIHRYAWEPWHFGFGANPRDVPAQYERGSFEPPRGQFHDGEHGMPRFVPSRYARPIARAATRWNVQPDLLAAQLFIESGFDPLARSPAGAQGIAQFMPATAREIGLADPFNASAAIDAQAHLMATLIRRYRSIPMALAAYNAGPRAVERYRGVPPFAETRAYVARILSLVDGSGAGLGDPAFAGIVVESRVVLVE